MGNTSFLPLILLRDGLGIRKGRRRCTSWLIQFCQDQVSLVTATVPTIAIRLYQPNTEVYGGVSHMQQLAYSSWPLGNQCTLHNPQRIQLQGSSGLPISQCF